MKQKMSLLVIGEEHEDALPEILRGSGCDVRVVRDCRGAREALSELPHPDVVVSGLSLTDGSWWTVLQEMVDHDHEAEIIVCLPDAETDAAAIRQGGGFDVLIPPYDPAQVRLLLEGATAPARERRERAKRRAV